MSSTVYHRPARLYPDVPSTTPITLANPPASDPPKSKWGSLMQSLVPMLTSCGSLAFIFLFPHISLILIVIMLGVSVVAAGSGVVLKISQSKSAAKKKKHDAQRYLEYLKEQELLMCHAADVQYHWFARLYPDSETLWYLVRQHQALWERRPTDADFGEVRIGTTSLPLSRHVQLESNNNPLADYDLTLLNGAEQLIDRFAALPNLPITINLPALGSLAIVGPSFARLAVVRSILAQLLTFQAPTDLQLYIAAPKTKQHEWTPLKWLPHVQQDAGSALPFPRITDSPQELTTLLNDALQARKSLLQNQRQQQIDATMAMNDEPQIVVVIDEYTPQSPIAHLPIIQELLRSATMLRVTVIALVDTLQQEPSLIGGHLILSGGLADFEESKVSSQKIRGIVPDQTSGVVIEQIARGLAPLRAEGGTSSKKALPSTIRLFDLLGIDSPATLDPAVTWGPRSLSQLLTVPIGYRSDGEPLLIDFKEAAVGGMGPHGLVVGATGSGKSELLRTLVTSLAVTHSPDLVAFVFVDFKGGAAFADLAELPHVAGLITNLQDDAGRVDRMYQALVGEQQRRQQLLRMAGNVDGIKEYHAARDLHPDLPPMPYLFIVVDEFAELIVQQPEFLDLFVAIGRIGRSIGMSLLFATQRLEEGRLRGLESHLRYRICLRTFSPQESTAVIGNPDAYSLPSSPGFGYFKVDSLYTQFKTAIVTGADVMPQQSAAVGSNIMIIPYSDTSLTSRRSKGSSTSAIVTEHSEMETAIERLNEKGSSLFQPPHQVWLPPLPQAATFTAVWPYGKSDAPILPSLIIPVGILDRPSEQRQEPFLVDLTGTNGHMAIIGAPQTGKSTFLRSLILSASLVSSPQQVQFYCIDLGGGGLHTISSLPNVATVCGKFERETMSRLLREVELYVEEREYLFRQHGVSNLKDLQQIAPKDARTCAEIVLVIDNWAHLKQEFEDIEADLAPIFTGGLGYGVHVLLTTGRWNDIRTNIRDSISNRLELRLNDPLDSEIDRKLSPKLPASTPGRVLTAAKLFAQIALPSLDETVEEGNASASLANAIDLSTTMWKDTPPAEPVRLLPLLLPISSLPNPQPTDAGFPLGVDEIHLAPVLVDIMESSPHLMVLGDSESGKTSVLRLMAHQLMRQFTPDEVQFTFLDYRRTLLDIGEGPYVAQYLATSNMAKDGIEELKATFTSRLPPAQITRNELLQRSWWSGPERIIFVDDYDLIVSPSSNPLQPLLDFLAQGHDVGMHLVLARRVTGISRSSFEPIMQRLREIGTMGLILSGDPHEGQILGSQKAQALPPGRGFLIRRRERTVLIQTGYVEPTEVAANVHSGGHV